MGQRLRRVPEWVLIKRCYKYLKKVIKEEGVSKYLFAPMLILSICVRPRRPNVRGCWITYLSPHAVGVVKVRPIPVGEEIPPIFKTIFGHLIILLAVFGTSVRHHGRSDDGRGDMGGVGALRDLTSDGVDVSR